jgi:hypothetical protein
LVDPLGNRPPHRSQSDQVEQTDELVQTAERGLEKGQRSKGEHFMTRDKRPNVAEAMVGTRQREYIKPILRGEAPRILEEATLRASGWQVVVDGNLHRGIHLEGRFGVGRILPADPRTGTSAFQLVLTR